MSLTENIASGDPRSHVTASQSATTPVRYWTAAEWWTAIRPLPQFNSSGAPPWQVAEGESMVDQEDEDRLATLHAMWDDWDSPTEAEDG